MSLNGLDSDEVAAAHAKAIAEPAGWFLLKYATRDEVELLGSGTAGFSEARETIAKYDEESPLFGLVVYKKKKALLRYVPEGTSRLLQARLAVHVQSVIEKFPHDALISLTTAVELIEPVLATSLATLKSSGSVKSPAPRSQRHLTEILEDSDDESSRRQPDEAEASKEAEEVNNEAQATADPILSPTSRSFSLHSDSAPRGSQETEKSNVSAKQTLEQDRTSHERPSYESRPSESFARANTFESDSSWSHRVKQKLGPRPSLEAGERSRGSGSFSRNVSTLPAGIRLGPKSPGFPPKSPGLERPRTGSSMKSFSSDGGRFAAVPSSRADSASSRKNSAAEVPEVPAIPADLGRWSVAPSPRADRHSSRSSPISPDAGNDVPEVQPEVQPEMQPEEPAIDPSIPPEKARLMKAMNQRKKNKMNRKASVDVQPLLQSQEPPVPQLLPPPAKMLQRKGSSLKIDSSLPAVQEHRVEGPLQTPSPKTYAPSPKTAPSPKGYSYVPPSPRSIPDTGYNIGQGQGSYGALRGRPKIAVPKYGEEVQAWASRVQTGARPAFNFPRSFNRAPSFPRSAGSSRNSSMTRQQSFGRSGSYNQKGSFARTNSSGVERGTLRKRKPSANIEFLSDVDSSEEEAEPAENLFGTDPTEAVPSRVSSNAASSISSEASRGRLRAKESLDAREINAKSSIAEETDDYEEENVEQASQQRSIQENHTMSAIDAVTLPSHKIHEAAEPAIVEQKPADASEQSAENQDDLGDELAEATIREPSETAVEEHGEGSGDQLSEKDTESTIHGVDEITVPAPSEDSALEPVDLEEPVAEHEASNTIQLPVDDAEDIHASAAEQLVQNDDTTMFNAQPVEDQGSEPHIVAAAGEEIEIDDTNLSNKATTRSISTTKSQGESEANVDLASPATEVSAAPAIDEDGVAVKEPEHSESSYECSLTAASDDESQLPKLYEPKHQSISTIASDDSQLTTKPSHLRLDTSKHNSSEVASVDGDALFEELRSAKVEQATPMVVPRSPGAYAFPIDVRPVSRDAAQLIHIASSSAGTNGSPDKSTFGRTSTTPDDLEPRASIESAPVKLSIQKVRAVEELRRTPSLSSNASRDGAVSPSGRKVSGVSKLISARIQAFENSGSSGGTAQTASTSMITPSIVSRRKASLTTPPGSSGVDGSHAGSRPSSRAYPTPSPSPHANLASRSGMHKHQPSDRLQPESASAPISSPRETFLRAESSSSSRKSSQASSPVNEGIGSYFSTRRDKKGSISSASSSIVESIREGVALTVNTSSGGRRGSRKSNDTVRVAGDTGSPMSPASESGRSSDGGDSSSVKKGSKRSRLLRRMSSIAMSPRRSIARQTIDESNEPENRKWIATVVGDINIQFPDTLLWKRRHMEIDSHGYIVLEPAKTDKASKVAVKQYHMSNFCAPYIPDQDRAELPHSIILDFMDSSTLQCACESANAQAKLLHVLSHAHRTFSKQR